MQETKVYKHRYVLPGQPPKIHYTIKLPHGVHRSIWGGTEDMVWENSLAYRWLSSNGPIGCPSSPQEATEDLGGTLGTPESKNVSYRILVVDCIPKKKPRGRRRKST